MPGRLVVAGAADGSVDVARSVREAGVEDRVHILGWVPDAAFFALLRAADLLMLLRFPSSGESSGVLARALGMGLPALAYDIGPASEYPDRFVEKVAFSDDPAAEVAAADQTPAGRPGAPCVGGGAEARDALRRERTADASAARILAAMRDWTTTGACCLTAVVIAPA